MTKINKKRKMERKKWWWKTQDSAEVVTIKLFQGLEGLFQAIGRLETQIALGL